MQWLVDVTNRRAVADGAGTGSYKDWTPLDREELYKFIGLFFANGLSPKPQCEYWFESTDPKPLFGNDMYSKAWINTTERQEGGQVGGLGTKCSADTSPWPITMIIQSRSNRRTLCG